MTSTLALAAAPAAAGAAPLPYEVLPGQPQTSAAFDVRYTGVSHTRTTYRGTPPNPGGAADLNRASDEGRVSWALTFPQGLTVPACSAVAPDPCAGVAGPTRADGKTAASGRIVHTHVDGLYDQLDAVDRCTVRSKGVPRTGLEARIDVVYDPSAAAFVVTARTPAVLALQLMPPNCISRPDGIDRILGNYFTPGFSYSAEYGVERWFTSASVAVPAATWLSSSRIRLRLGLTNEGRPPKNCATRFKYERCRTSGSWSGVLTFTRR